MPDPSVPEPSRSEMSVTASVRDSGNRLDRTVILIHGSMDRQAAFSRLARILGSTCRVISYDRRGYGRSALVRGPYSVERQVADLMNVLDHCECKSPVVLVGHSFGGAVALAAVQHFAERVLGAVIYESPMSWEPWWPTDTGGSIAVASAQDPGQAAENFMKRFIGNRRWDELPISTRSQRRSEGVALVGELSDIRKVRPWNAESLRGPIMAGYGGLSKPHLRHSAQVIGDLPDCRAVELRTAHHNAHSAQPEQFVELLINPLLRRIDQGIWL